MTKFQYAWLILPLSILMLTEVTQASTFERNIIEVRGQATVTVQPDQFSLTLAIVQTGRNTSKIRSLVDHKSNQVISIAKSIDVPAKSINSARIKLRVIKEHSPVHVQGVEVRQKLPQNLPQHNMVPNRGKVYVGVDSANKGNNSKVQNFELSRMITVNFSSIESYDQFLNKVIKLGVERISPLTMTIENSEKSYQLALAKAIDNAKKKAKQMANQANIHLGKLVYLQELSGNHYQRGLSVVGIYSDTANDHSSQVAEKAINARVLVRFSINN